MLRNAIILRTAHGVASSEVESWTRCVGKELGTCTRKQRETDKTEVKRPKSAEPLAQRCVHLLATTAALFLLEKQKSLPREFLP